MQIQDGETILFIGDSITDCGRRETQDFLGNGYVRRFADLLLIREPGKRIRVINKGISGDVVTGLRNRWQDDVLRHEPDWLSIMIGINDLHRTLGEDLLAVPPALYQEAYEDILSATAADLPGCRVVLVDPFYISSDSAPYSFRRTVLDLLQEYLEVVHALSRKHGTLRVTTQEVFQALLAAHEPDEFCPEPVHPNMTGHMVIAEAVYAALV